MVLKWVSVLSGIKAIGHLMVFKGMSILSGIEAIGFNGP